MEQTLSSWLHLMEVVWSDSSEGNLWVYPIFLTRRKCIDLHLHFIGFFDNCNGIQDKLNETFTKLCTYLQLIKNGLQVKNVIKVELLRGEHVHFRQRKKERYITVQSAVILLSVRGDSLFNIAFLLIRALLIVVMYAYNQTWLNLT